MRIRATQGFVFPAKQDDSDFWLRWAHRAYSAGAEGKLVPKYDGAVVSSLAQAPKCEDCSLDGWLF